MNLYWLLGLVTLCAIAGDQLGYFIGWKAGPSLFKRQDSRFFKRSHLQRAHEFYEINGGKTVIMARFVPIIRTFCPPVAGAAAMSYGRYLAFDVVGGFAWVWSMVLFGYGVVATFPALGKHVDLLVLGVIFVSLIPAGLHRGKNCEEESPRRAVADGRTRRLAGVGFAGAKSKGEPPRRLAHRQHCLCYERRRSCKVINLFPWNFPPKVNYFRKRPSRTWSRPTKVLEERNLPKMSRISRF